MYHMLSCFNLKPDVSAGAFSESMNALFTHLQEIGLVESVSPLCRRDSDTPMDTDDERDHHFFFVTNFVDKTQCDRSYDYILSHREAGDSVHDAVYQKVVDPVFICYAELP